MFKTIIAAIAIMFATAAHADQQTSFNTNSGKVVQYTTYEAASMKNKDLGSMVKVFRGCARVNATAVTLKENLQKDSNIAGAFYCKQPAETRTYVVVKKLN